MRYSENNRQKVRVGVRGSETDLEVLNSFDQGEREEREVVLVGGW